MKKDFIVLDIETTGFSPTKNQITEIGALKVNGETLEIISEYSSLAKIDGFVPPFIEQLTGITDQMLRDNGNELKSILEGLSSFCENLDIYAHYAPFDKSFIRHYLEEHNIGYVQSKWVDTIDIFKKEFPGRTTYKLESLIRDYNLADSEDHRAISDATYTLELLKITKK